MTAVTTLLSFGMLRLSHIPFIRNIRLAALLGASFAVALALLHTNSPAIRTP